MAHLHLQNVSIEEEKGVKSLRLGGRCDRPGRGQVIDEGHDAIRAKDTRMLTVMEMDVTADPKPVGVFGSAAQVPSPAHHGHEVHEPKRGNGCGVQVTP